MSPPWLLLLTNLTLGEIVTPDHVIIGAHLALFRAAITELQGEAFFLLSGLDPVDSDLLIDSLDVLCRSARRKLAFLDARDVNATEQMLSSCCQNNEITFIYGQAEEPFWTRVSDYQSVSSNIWLAPHSYSTPGLKLRLDSRFFTYEFNSTSSAIIREVYAIKGGPRRVLPLGSWSLPEGAILNRKNLFERRSNLSGITLSAAYLHFEPMANVRRNGTTILEVSGVFPEVFDTLMEALQFRYEKVYPDGGLWGNVQADGSVNGVTGMLYRKELDIFASLMAMSRERIQVIDFSMPIFIEEGTLIVQKAKGKAINFWAYMQIFTIPVWVLLATFIVSFAVHYRVVRVIMPDAITDNKFCMGTALGLALAVLVQKDFPVSRHTLTVRIAFLVSCVTSFLFYAYYTADLTSLMTSRPRGNDLQQFSDVLPQGYQVITVKGTLYHADLVSQAHKVLHEIYTTTIAGHPKYLMDGPEDVKNYIRNNPRAAMFGPATMVIMDQDLVALDLIDKLRNDFCFGLQKDSEFTGMFNYHLKKLGEQGVIKKIRNKWLPPKLNKDETTAHTLGYDNLLFPFILLGVGLTVSGVLAIGEALLRSRL